MLILKIIERRFLVNKNNFIPPKNYNSIEQAYLIFDNNQILRVRKTNDKYQRDNKVLTTENDNLRDELQALKLSRRPF